MAMEKNTSWIFFNSSFPGSLCVIDLDITIYTQPPSNMITSYFISVGVYKKSTVDASFSALLYGYTYIQTQHSLFLIQGSIASTSLTGTLSATCTGCSTSVEAQIEGEITGTVAETRYTNDYPALFIQTVNANKQVQLEDRTNQDEYYVLVLVPLEYSGPAPDQSKIYLGYTLSKKQCILEFDETVF